MNPEHHAKSHYDYFKDLLKGDDVSAETHRKFYDEYNAVLDMDADYYLETIATVFQDFKLVNGTWQVKGVDGKTELVRPQDITNCALLTVEGELDDISGSGQTKAAHDLCTQIPADQQQHFEVKGAGHYGIFSGRRWREIVYPKVKDFILTHSPKPVAAAATSSAAKADAAAPSAPRSTSAAKSARAEKAVAAVAPRQKALALEKPERAQASATKLPKAAKPTALAPQATAPTKSSTRKTPRV
jgi:poly(3-hydroxybutyrate) depolymerase